MSVLSHRYPGARTLERLRAQPLLWHLILGVLGAGFFYVLTTSIGDYQNQELQQIGIYAIAIAGLSLLTGVSGQISLGHGAFMAIGAYGAGLMMAHYDLPLIVPILVGIGAAAALGAVFGLPAARLRGPYLAGITLALALAIQDIPNKFSSLFNGDSGIVINQPTPPGFVDQARWITWLCLGGAIVTMIVLGNFMKSRYGRALKAVRDDEVAAEASGLNPARLRVLAFTISAAVAGLSGALFALYLSDVNPNTFSLFLSIQLLAGMVIGGAGTLFGAWWGAVALVYVPDWTNSLTSHFTSTTGLFGTTSPVAANMQTAVFGLLIIVIMMLAPSGIQGWLRAGLHKLRRRAAKKDLGSFGGEGAGPLTTSTTNPAPERTNP
jgi:branched-chain amino acid transport system permease protein